MTAVMETPAARTLAKRLERAGVAETDNESTAAWIDTLHAYEQVMAKEVRMVSSRLTSQAPEETSTEEAVGAAAYERLAAAVAAFDANGTTAREMIAWLGRWLDIIAAL